MPLMIINVTQNKIWAAIFTFLPTFGMFSLNLIGMELENPFGADDNDLPLSNFQHEMNSSLLMFLETHADICPGISETRCEYDFQTLLGKKNKDSDRKKSMHSTTVEDM